MTAMPLEINGVTYTPPGMTWMLSVPRFLLQENDFVGLIGPNGAGKSTLLKIIAGILSPDKGKVMLMGKDISILNRRKIARMLGYLPQNADGGRLNIPPVMGQGILSSG